MDDREKQPDPDVIAFMRGIARDLGTQGSTETFSRLVELQALPASEFRKFAKWWGGHNAPNNKATMNLVSTARSARAPIATALDELEMIVRRLDEVPDDQIEAVSEALRVMSERLQRVVALLAERSQRLGDS